MYRRSAAAYDAAARRVLQSGRVVLGPEVDSFERSFAAYVGSRYAVGVASGTDALELSLRAVGVDHGDEVITVANAGIPPLAAILACGAQPRFVDVDPLRLLIDPEQVEGAITPRTRAVLAVHLYGQLAPVQALATICRAGGIALVEDCAHAHGLRDAGRHVGRFGAVAGFSFYPTKNLGAFGDGGACVTDDAEVAARLRELRVYGTDANGIPRRVGINSRLDELQAAFLSIGLRSLEEQVERRRHLARIYTRELAGSRVVPLPRDHDADAFHLYVVRTSSRAEVESDLEAAEIGCKRHYDPPLHRFAVLTGAPPSPELPHTEAACREVLSLPLHPGLRDEQIVRIAARAGGR